MIFNYSNTHLGSLKKMLYPHRWAVIFTFILALLLILHSTSAYRGAISFPRAHWNNGNSFDDAANSVALHNFQRDGFVTSRGNENRKGMVLQDFFSIPCLDQQGKKAVPSAESDYYKDIDGFEVPLIAKDQNCFYHRTPPLHLWLNYSLLKLTGFYQRTLPITNSLLMALWIYALYLLIAQFSSRRSALLAAIFFASSMEFLGWSQASYNQPYQNLFFTLSLYYFHRTMNEGKGKVRLVIFSAAHALCTFELVPMQLTYMLFTLLIKKNRPWRSVALGASGIFLALLLFALWFSLFAVDQMNLIQLLSNGMAERYAHAFSFSRWFLGQWYETFNILSGTIYSHSILLTLLCVVFFCSAPNDRLTKIRILAGFFLSAWAFHFLLPGHASYHVFILAKAFIPFYLLLLALAIDSALAWLRKKEPIFVYAAIIVAFLFIGRSAIGVRDYLQYYWQATDKDDRPNIARQSIGFLVSFHPSAIEVVKIPKNLKWEYYYFKNRLLDGLVPDRKGEDWRWAVTIDKALGVDFDWFYSQPTRFQKIEVISSAQMQNGDCSLQAGKGTKPQVIELEQESIETNQFWQKRVYRFSALDADWVRWSCRSKHNFYLYELRLL